MPEITIRGIDGAGDQIFRGKDDAELVEQLAKAQEHATRLIRKQAKQITTLTDLIGGLFASKAIDGLANNKDADDDD